MRMKYAPVKLLKSPAPFIALNRFQRISNMFYIARTPLLIFTLTLIFSVRFSYNIGMRLKLQHNKCGLHLLTKPQARKGTKIKLNTITKTTASKRNNT